MSPKTDPDRELEWICRSAFRRFGTLSGADVSASFYPYVGLTHTIRRRGSRWIVRVSDHCRHARRAVLEAIVHLLACKIARRRPPAATVDIYERFRREPYVEALVDERRRRRGKKLIADPAGTHHSLLEIYHELNAGYFNGQVELQRIGWGPRRAWTRLGHYDPVHHTITISPVLDSPAVPRSALAFVVYHELLHALFDENPGKRRRLHHTAAFRKAEQGYSGYASARTFLDKFCASHGKMLPAFRCK